MSAAWLDVLRAACEASSQRDVARRLGYSSTVINQVLTGAYPHGLAKVQAKVEKALMAGTVTCPELGAIPRAQCLAWQRRPFSAANPTAVAVYRACRSGCPHSLLIPVLAPAAQPAVARPENTGSRGVVLPFATPSQATSHRVTRPTGRRKRPTHSRGGKA